MIPFFLFAPHFFGWVKNGKETQNWNIKKRIKCKYLQFVFLFFSVSFSHFRSINLTRFFFHFFLCFSNFRFLCISPNTNWQLTEWWNQMKWMNCEHWVCGVVWRECLYVGKYYDEFMFVFCVCYTGLGMQFYVRFFCELHTMIYEWWR